MKSKSKKVFTEDEFQVLKKICLKYKEQKNCILSKIESKILDGFI